MRSGASHEGGATVKVFVGFLLDRLHTHLALL